MVGGNVMTKDLPSASGIWVGVAVRPVDFDPKLNVHEPRRCLHSLTIAKSETPMTQFLLLFPTASSDRRYSPHQLRSNRSEKRGMWREIITIPPGLNLATEMR